MALAALAGSVSPVQAATYQVNPQGTGDFPTIQAALDAVVDGDVVELAAGTFTGNGNRDLDFLGKAVTVRSASGLPETCIIDCEHHYTKVGFHFETGEGSGSVLAGVTVTNTETAVYCHGSAPTLTSCVFHEVWGNGLRSSGAGAPVAEHCMFTQCGGSGAVCIEGQLTLRECLLKGCDGSGLYAVESQVTVQQSVVIENADHGVACECSALEMDHCLVVNNHNLRVGGGLYCAKSDEVTLNHCTFALNGAPRGGGIYCINASPSVQNCIIAFGTEGDAVYCDDTYGPADPHMSCCDIFGNAGGDWVGHIADQLGQEGNISADPLFCNSPVGDFHLQNCSPCAPYTPPNSECDQIGAYGVGCGGSAVRATSWGRLRGMFRVR